jgi:putative flippase GtrA
MLKQLYLSRPEGQRQFLKFCMVGGIGFVVDAGSYTLLTYFFGLGPLTGRLISAAGFGMTTTWLLNRSLTFRNQRGGPIGSEYLRFATANGIGLLLNIGTHTLLVGNVGLFAAFPILGIVAGTAVGLVFNFTGSKYFVFRRT